MVKNNTIKKTTTVDLVISSHVGQVTFLSSALASCKNFIAFIIYLILSKLMVQGGKESNPH